VPGREPPAESLRQHLEYGALFGHGLCPPRPPRGLQERGEVRHAPLAHRPGGQIHNRPRQRQIAIAVILPPEHQRLEVIEQFPRRGRPARLTAEP